MLKIPLEKRESILERLMFMYGDQVIRMCFLFLRNRELAEDASQETFIRAWKAIDRLREGPTEKAWLIKIAINVCKSFLNNHTERIFNQKIPESSITAVGIIDHYSDDTVYQSIEALPIKYRYVVILYYYQGLSIKEMAAILHLPGATIRTRLSRARAMLKGDLKGWYFDNE